MLRTLTNFSTATSAITQENTPMLQRFINTAYSSYSIAYENLSEQNKAILKILADISANIDTNQKVSIWDDFDKNPSHYRLSFTPPDNV